MVLRRAIAKLIPSVELHYSTARAEIDLGPIGIGSGVPAARPMVRLSDPTDGQLIVPSEIGTRDLDSVLPTEYARTKKTRLQVAANRAAYLLDKADLESALLTYRL
jgi:hypothetical protein